MFSLSLSLSQGPPGVCSGCVVQANPTKTHFYISAPGKNPTLPKYGTLEHPAPSCYDLSLVDDKMKTSKRTHAQSHPHTHIQFLCSISANLASIIVIFMLSIDTTYYVDPNGGSHEDALEVTCRKMELYQGWFTCIKPQKSILVSVTIILSPYYHQFEYCNNYSSFVTSSIICSNC